MVANAIGRPPTPRPVGHDEDVYESSLRENLIRQLDPVLSRLKNRWVILAIFLASYVPFGIIYVRAYQDYNVLEDRIGAQEAVLALPEPRTGDIESGLRSWTAALQAATEAQILELEDSSLVEKLLAAAAGVGVSLNSLSTSNNEIVPVGAEIYDVTPVLLRFTGDVAAIESFIAVLEGDAIGALEVQNSLVAPESDDMYAGTLRALVFNRPIDPSELEVEQLEALSRRVTDAELDAAAGLSAGGGR